MSKITQFTRANARILREELETRLQKRFAKYLKKNGYTMTLGKCRFDPGMANFQLIITLPEVNAEKVNHELKAFFGLELGATTTLQGRTFKLIGINPRAPKNAMQIQEISSGRKFKCSEAAFKAGMTKKNS